MHFDRIGCRLHNLLPLPAASHSSTSARLSSAESPSSLSRFLRLSRAPSLFSVRSYLPSAKTIAFLCSWQAGKFRFLYVRSRLIYIRRSIEFHTTIVHLEGSSITIVAVSANESSQLRLLVGIGFPQIDCVYASPGRRRRRRPR